MNQAISSIISLLNADLNSFQSLFQYLSSGTPDLFYTFNIIGLILSTMVTLLILVVDIIGHIKWRKYQQYFHPYNNAFNRSFSSSAMSILTVLCSVWFLVELIYIYLKF